MIVMKDVAISKSEFVAGESAITKIQDFNLDPVLFDYCKYPAVSHLETIQFASNEWEYTNIGR
jgi:hypothetical protein